MINLSKILLSSRLSSWKRRDHYCRSQVTTSRMPHENRHTNTPPYHRRLCIHCSKVGTRWTMYFRWPSWKSTITAQSASARRSTWSTQEPLHLELLFRHKPKAGTPAPGASTGAPSLYDPPSTSRRTRKGRAASSRSGRRGRLALALMYRFARTDLRQPTKPFWTNLIPLSGSN
jgi:hypothetical protein